MDCVSRFKEGGVGGGHPFRVHAWAQDPPTVPTQAVLLAVLIPDSAPEMIGQDLAGTRGPDGHTNTLVDQPVDASLSGRLKGVHGWPSDPMDCIGH